MTALIALFTLTREQRHFMWRKQISDTRTPDAWLALFRPLTRFESALGAGGCLPLALGIVAGLLLVLGLAVLGDGNSIAGGLIILCLAVAGAMAAWGVWRLRLHGQHLAYVLNPLLAVLREDVAAGEAVTLTVDLRGPERAQNKVGERQLPATGAYFKIAETTFAEGWLQGDATLADGARLSWSVTDYVRRARRSKKSASGKIKTKVRFRIATQVRLQLGLRRERFELRGPVPSGVAQSDDGRRLWFKLRQTFRYDGDERFGATEFVQTVARAYGCVQPAAGGAA